MHRMSCTSKRKIPTCRHFTLIRWSIRSRIGKQFKLLRSAGSRRTKSSHWTKMYNHSYKIHHYIRTIRPTGSRYYGHHARSICVPAVCVVPSIFHWLNHGTRNTVRPAIRSKCASATRNYSSIMCLMRWNIADRNHRKSDTCSVRSKRRNSSRPRPSIG